MVKSLPVIPRSTSLSYVSNRDSSQSSCCPYMMAAIQSDVGIRLTDSFATSGAGGSEGNCGRAREERRDGEVSRRRGLVGRWCRGSELPARQAPSSPARATSGLARDTSRDPRNPALVGSPPLETAVWKPNKPSVCKQLSAQECLILCARRGATVMFKGTVPKATRHPAPSLAVLLQAQRVAVFVFCPCSGSGWMVEPATTTLGVRSRD